MQPRKQHLLDTAYRLFNEHGYHATGIDRILAESGVSKATLYKYFRTKDDLILAVLQQRHDQLIQLIKQAIERARERGESAPLAIFDVLDRWFRNDGFFGCNFINASAEYAAAGNPVYAFAAHHKTAIQQLLEQSLETIAKRKRKALAAQLALLVDGAIVRAHTRGETTAAILAKRMAAQLLAGQS